ATGPGGPAGAVRGAGSVTSQRSARPVPPRSAQRAAVFSAASPSTSAQITVAPPAAKAAAVARPIPLPAPVTTTTAPAASLLTMSQYHTRLLTKGQLARGHGHRRAREPPAGPRLPSGPA